MPAYMRVSAGYLTVAVLLEEAAAMGHTDLHRRLEKAIRTAHPDDYTNLVDVIGDESAGDAIYSKGYSERSPLKRAKYESGGGDLSVDCANASDCMPLTSYEDVPDDASQYVTMAESEKLYNAGQVPLFERFIGKAERDKADEADFAGKGKSFPILKADDVRAALSSIGRAGSGNHSAAKLKANILAIAKRKGFAVPAADTTDAKEAAKRAAELAAGALALNESAAFPVDVPLRETVFKPGYQIKLIAPGKGSTAFYPAEVLKRDGPQIFKAGTPMCIDHPTRAEESARPEGSVKDWGAVLAKDAIWLDEGQHAQGAGLYSEVKPFSDHAATIAEKGPYAGVSIRARGEAEMKNGQPVMREGVPVLARLTGAESVDMVTRAGAGGMFLTEAARAAATQPTGDAMTEQEATQLRESNTKLAGSITVLLERALRGDAREFARRSLKDMSLAEAAKDRVIETVCAGTIPQKDGVLDTAAFTATITEAAKREGEYVASLVGSGRVIGMGAPAPVELTEAQRKERDDAAARDLRESTDVFTDLMGDKNAAAIAAKGRYQ